MDAPVRPLPLFPLGKTGLKVSPLGFGSVKLGRNEAVKYATPYTLPDEEQTQEILRHIEKSGINLIDTAPSYGTAEEKLGKCLGNREKWIISTKVGEIFENGVSRYDFSPDFIQKSLESSLKRLQTDYVDILLLHLPYEMQQQVISDKNVLNTLENLKQQGLIKATGASTLGAPAGLAAVDLFDVLMVTLNPAYDEEIPVIEKAHQTGTGILIKKGLVSGHLDNIKAKNPVESCLEFISGHKGVHSTVISSLNLLHIEENARLASKYFFDK